MCRGSAGKIECTPEFKCLTINGARNDTGCSNRVEANDCGLYPSVFCLGGQLQQGAPACATSCASDSECDIQAHCADGKCEADKPNGERCKRKEDCAAGFCKNMVNDEGICCGLNGDCCTTPDDCPATYRKAATCNDQMNCRGSETVATCMANICGMMVVPANPACDGKPGPNCGAYQDVTCMSGRSNACRTMCTNDGQCDTGSAYCDGRACQMKKPNGGACTMPKECTSGVCNNGVCCTGPECCKTVADCKAIDATCNAMADRCQGTIRMPMCESSTCRYPSRIDDDRACTGPRPGTCSNFRDIMCDGKSDQNPMCLTTCTADGDCDPGSVCMDVANQPKQCRSAESGGDGSSGSGNGG